MARSNRALSSSFGAGDPELYAALVESSSDAFIVKDRDAVIVRWNPAAERMYGYTAAEAIGRSISILVPSRLAGEEREILERILAGERIDHYETERVRKDGAEIVVSLSISPVRGAGGEIVAASVIARDITARHRALARAERLRKMTSALSKEVTPERTVEVLLEHAIAGLDADAGAVGLLDPEAAAVRLAVTSGYSESGLSGWEEFSLSADIPIAAAIRELAPLWLNSPDELLERFPALAERDVRFSGLAVVPLVVEGKPLGALALSFERASDLDPEQRAFLLAIVQQAAYSLERAELYEAQRIANHQLALLAEASELLAGSLDPDESLTKLAELVTARLADWCAIDVADEDGSVRHVTVVHADAGQKELVEEIRGLYPIDPDAAQGAPAVIRTGEAEFYPEVEPEMLDEGLVDPRYATLIRKLGIHSAMVVPLPARGRVIGALTLVASTRAGAFTNRDFELAKELARRAALAIDNASLFRREHEAARILQRSILPESLPSIEGLEFAARYEPAGAHLEVGGDWYEVVPRPAGTVGVMIGDVAGRGIRAASVMGRIRPALRAFISDGHGARESMERLDALLKGLDDAELTTIFYLQLDPRTGEAEYVRAGHLPALVRTVEGEVLELYGDGSPPIGILGEREFRVNETRLAAGSLVLMYTDGLIERRGENLTDSIDNLKAELARTPPEPGRVVDSLIERFRPDEAADDVAMLATLLR